MEMITKEDPRTSMKLLYLHIAIKSLQFVSKTKTSGYPKMFPTGLELALENGDTCLWIYPTLRKQDCLLIFAFFQSHDYYDSKGTGNVQKNFCPTEQKLLTRVTIKKRKLKIIKTCTDKITMRLLNNIQKRTFLVSNLHKNQRGRYYDFAEHFLFSRCNIIAKKIQDFLICRTSYIWWSVNYKLATDLN